MTSSATTLGLMVLALVACGDDTPKSGNGVNDVRVACEIRAKFVRANNSCGVCEAAVVSPRCDCSELKEFSAACIDQADARKGVCPETVDQCVFACQATDCGCIEACYANDARCKSASAARDGCIADTCQSHCK